MGTWAALSTRARHISRLLSRLPSLTSTISCPPAIERPSSAPTSSPTLPAPLKTGITIDNVKRGGPILGYLGSASVMRRSLLGSYGEDRAAERESHSRPQEGGLQAHRHTAQCVDRARIQGDVAGRAGVRRKELARDRHQRKQDCVPISRIDKLKTGRVQQPAEAPQSVAPDIVYGGVMAREHPAIGRQIEHEASIFREAAVELRKRTALLNQTMAQDIGAENCSKGACSKGKGIDRSGAYRPAALGRCTSAGLQIGVEAEQGAVGVTGS